MRNAIKQRMNVSLPLRGPMLGLVSRFRIIDHFAAHSYSETKGH